MGLDKTKPVFGEFANSVKLKPACSATKTSFTLKILQVQLIYFPENE